MSAFIRPLPPDDYPDEQPSSSATLSIVLEPAPAATIGELVRNLATAMLTAVSGRTLARRKGYREKVPPGEPPPPGS